MTTSTLCPFALLTGLACPGCGLTRAAVSLARGDLAASWAFHPLALLVALWAVAGTVMWIRRRRRGGSASRPVMVDRLLVSTAGVFVVTWLVRLATGTLPPV